MARSDLILNLVKAGSRGDQVLLQRTVEAMVIEERAKKHDVLADRLLAQMRSDVNGHPRTLANGASRGATGAFTFETYPERRLSTLVLPPDTAETIAGLVDEQHRGNLLRDRNLTPRNRVLLVGPPGNGKTSLAEALADALHVPMFTVRYDAVIASYLGETAQRLGQVFEQARTRRCVLFFDEFDSIAKERGDDRETGEIKRVVSSLLLQVDALPSHVVIVTASNHPELLDRAVWRRFQVRLEMPLPTQGQVEEWLGRFEERTDQRLGVPLRDIAKRMVGMSFGEIEDVALDIMRKIVLAKPPIDPRSITETRLRKIENRTGATP